MFLHIRIKHDGTIFLGEKVHFYRPVLFGNGYRMALSIGFSVFSTSPLREITFCSHSPLEILCQI